MKPETAFGDADVTMTLNKCIEVIAKPETFPDVVVLTACARMLDELKIRDIVSAKYMTLVRQAVELVNKHIGVK